MSAQSEFAAVINRAITNAGLLADAARAMVGESIQAMKAWNAKLPGEQPGYFEAGAGGGSGIVPTQSPAPAPVVFPQRPAEPFPALGAVPSVETTFDAEFPELTLPAFRYPAIGGLAAFDAEWPEVQSALALPEFPDLSGDLPALPELSRAATLPDVALAVRAPDFADAPALETLDRALFPEALRHYLALVLGQVAPPARAVEDAAQAEIDALLDRMLAAVDFPGNATLADRLAALWAELAEWIETTATGARSGQPLPPAVQQAVRASAEQWSAAVARQVESQLASRKIELQEALRQALQGVLTDVVNGLKGLRLREAEQNLRAHQFAARYAKRVTGAILRAFEAANFDAYDVELARTSLRLDVAESEMLLGTLEYELTKARQKAAAAVQDRDGLAVARHAAEGERQQQAVTLFAGRVAALRAEQKAQRLPWELYFKQVQLVDATAAADEAAYQLAIAQASGNSALLEGASAAMDAHRARQRAFASELAMIEAATDADITANESILTEYAAKVQTAVGDAEMGVADDKRNLSHYEMTVGAMMQDARIDLERARAQIEHEQGATALEAKVQEANRALAQAVAELQLSQDKAIADASADAARLLGNMAEAATSAANGLAYVGQETLV